MKKLALSMRVPEASHYCEKRNSLAYDYIDFFESLGFLVIPIPNNTNRIKDYIEELNVDGIVLTGGNNVDPKLYGGKEELDSVYHERDTREQQLVEIAKEKGIPLLGVCRGFHYVNVHFEGSIFHDVKNHVAKNHKLISDKVLLGGLDTNSYHNQAIFKENLAKNLISIAHTEDGAIEAFVHESYKIMGIQWHPERNSTVQDKELILNFFNK